jgi:ABC-type polysaccharide/polyol phosphate export permease
LNTFLVLVKLRVRDVARKGSALAFFFLLPLVLLGVVGVVFAKGHPFEQRRVVLVLPQIGEDETPLRIAKTFARAVEASPGVKIQETWDEDEAMGALRSRMAAAVAMVDVTDPARPHVRLLLGPDDRLFGRGLAVTVADRVKVVEVPLEIGRWGYVHFLLPGLIAFTVLLSGLFGMGTNMARYRQSLFLKKLATTPLPRWKFVLAQIVARALLVVVQLVVMVGAAHFVFGVPLGLRALGLLVMIATLGVLTFTGIGFVLACVIRSEAVLTDAISASTTPLVLFSEIFFPLDALPDALAKVCVALPSTQMVRMMRAVLVANVTEPGRLVGPLATLALWAIATYALSLWLFDWRA